MKIQNLLLFLLICTFSFGQKDNLQKKNRVLSFGVFIPSVGFVHQRISHPAFPSQTSPLRLGSKLNLADYEILKARLILWDQISLGARLVLNSRKNPKNGLQNLENDHYDLHISNWSQKKLSHLFPGFFIGYRYPYNKTETKTHFIGCNIYLNFDNFNYGKYSYDAKNVSDNHFYHYDFTTKVKNSKSFTFELDHSTRFTFTNSKVKALLGIRAGFTPRNQSIQFTESFRDPDNNTVETQSSVKFKSWSLHLGIYFSVER